MKNTLNMMVLFFGMAFIAPRVAYADPCASAEREMVQGQTAIEFAKDQNGYEKAVRLFERAIEKSPNCADAYYNLGLVYEKTTDYAKAKSALGKYLQLSPKAKDAAAVRRQIYRLEFIIANNGETERKKSGPWYSTASRAHLGAYISEVDSAIMRTLGLENKHGALVRQVANGSAADKAGIKPEDVIVSVDGEPVKVMHDLPLRIARYRPGDKVSVGLIRAGRTMAITVKLGQ